jgi:hypothetical protein
MKSVRFTYIKTISKDKELLDECTFEYHWSRERRDLVKWAVDRLKKYRKIEAKSNKSSEQKTKVTLKINGKTYKTYNKEKLLVKHNSRRLPKKIKLYEL